MGDRGRRQVAMIKDAYTDANVYTHTYAVTYTYTHAHTFTYIYTPARTATMRLIRRSCT